LKLPINWRAACSAFQSIGVPISIEELKKICEERNIVSGEQLLEAVMDIAEKYAN